jgi:hypothetical protein
VHPCPSKMSTEMNLDMATQLGRHLLAVMAIFSGSACATLAERPADLAPLKPAPQEVDAFVRAALSDRFAAGDIPDQNLVADHNPIYLFDEMERSAYQLSPAALPEVAGRRFALVTRTQARDIAYGRGGICLLEVDGVELSGDRARLRIGVSAYPDVTKSLMYGGGSAEAEFRRGTDGKWIFATWGPILWSSGRRSLVLLLARGSSTKSKWTKSGASPTRSCIQIAVQSDAASDGPSPRP